MGHRRLRRRRARVGAHGGIRHPLRLGRVLDEEVTPRARRCRAPSGPTRRSDSSARRSSSRRSPSSPASPRRSSTSPSPRTPTQAPLATPGVAPPAASGAPRAVARARARAVDLARHDRRRRARLLAHGAHRAGRRRMLPVHGGRRLQRARCAASRGCRCSTTSFTQRGSLPVYVGTIFVVFVAAEGTALLAGSEWQAQLDAYQTPMQLVVAPIMIVGGPHRRARAQALHRRRARVGHRPRHGAAVRDERRTRPRAHAGPRRDRDARGVRARAAPHPVAARRAQRLGLARRAGRARRAPSA